MNWSALFARAWPYRGPLSLCLLLMMLESGAGLVAPVLGAWIVTGLLGESGVGIGVLAPALLLLLAVQTGLQVVQARLVSRTTAHIVADLRQGLYDHLQRLPVGFFQTRRQGDLLSMLTWEVEVLSDFITATLLSVLPGLLTLVGALVLMFLIDPLLTVPLMVGVPLFYLTMKVIGRRLRPLSERIRDAQAAMLSVEEANLAILPAIKSYTREDLESAGHKTHVERHRDLSLRFARFQETVGPLTSYVFAAAVICVIWLAAGQIRQGEMTPGELVAFLLYAAMLTAPTATFANIWTEYQHARGALTHMEDVMSHGAEPTGTQDLGVIHGEIRFEKVGFAFPDRPAVLQDIDLRIDAGTIVAITGPNGAGKSTLVELLMRFHIPSAGRITLDGIDLSALDLAALRRAIAFVPQDPMLIDGSIEANIRFGRPDADAAAIETAARRAQAWAFIREFPDGLATRIGDRGVRLSGGQRQRIALARALLKDPAILILDEPTAMFDPVGERAFVAAAREALKDRTVILVTHRPASLELADRILKLDGGRFVSAGGETVAPAG